MKYFKLTLLCVFIIVINTIITNVIVVSADNIKVIHVFVALCDNESQGIVPVSERIGDGDRPDENLYWGSSDGLKGYFSKSKNWEIVKTYKNVSAVILRRIVFKHKSTGSIMVADAYKGDGIKQCLTDFIRSSEGIFKSQITIDGIGEISLGSDADLIAYIGHNDFMEHTIEFPEMNEEKISKDAIVLACQILIKKHNKSIQRISLRRFVASQNR